MKNKNKIRLFLSFFIILNIVIVLFLLLPLFKNLKENSNNLINTRNEEFLFDGQINKLNEFKQNRDMYKNNFQKLEQILVDSKNPIYLIESIENMAKESNVLLDITLMSNLNKKLESDYWPSLFLQINSLGDLANTMKFLAKLENSSYLISVQNLKLSKNESTAKLKSKLDSEIKASYLVKVFTN